MPVYRVEYKGGGEEVVHVDTFGTLIRYLANANQEVRNVWLQVSDLYKERSRRGSDS